MSSPRPSDLPEALRLWCDWIFEGAYDDFRAASRRTKRTTWLDFCGEHERKLIKAAMRRGVWSVPAEVKPEAAA